MCGCAQRRDNVVKAAKAVARGDMIMVAKQAKAFSATLAADVYGLWKAQVIAARARNRGERMVER